MRATRPLLTGPPAEAWRGGRAPRQRGLPGDRRPRLPPANRRRRKAGPPWLRGIAAATALLTTLALLAAAAAAAAAAEGRPDASPPTQGHRRSVVPANAAAALEPDTPDTAILKSSASAWHPTPSGLATTLSNHRGRREVPEDTPPEQRKKAAPKRTEELQEGGADGGDTAKARPSEDGPPTDSMLPSHFSPREDVEDVEGWGGEAARPQTDGGDGTYGISKPFSAFDCDARGTKVSMLDATAPKLCEDPQEDYLNETRTVTVTLIDSGLLTHQEAHSCKVLVSKYVQVCGFDGLAYGAEMEVQLEEPYPVTAAQCNMAMASGNLTVEGRVYPVSTGKPTVESVFTHGQSDARGFCTYDSFYFKSVFYPRAVMKSTVKIILSKHQTVHDWELDRLIIDDTFRLKASPGFGLHPQLGTVVWNHNTRVTCSQTYYRVYEGDATMHVRRENYMTNNELHNILLINDDSSGQQAGLTLDRKVSPCKFKCYQTQAKHLIACLHYKHRGGIDMANVEFGDENGSTVKDLHVTDVHASLTHTILQNRVGFTKLFAALSMQVCKNTRRITTNQLNDLRNGVNEDVVASMFGPGFRIVPAGQVAYLFQCRNVTVKLADADFCTDEIPVHYNGTIRHINSFSRILTRPTRRPCSPVTPVAWKIKDEWYCSSPAISRCSRDPVKLQHDHSAINQQIEDLLKDPIGGQVFSDKAWDENKKAMAILTNYPKVKREFLNKVLTRDHDFVDLDEPHPQRSSKGNQYYAALGSIATHMPLMLEEGQQLVESAGTLSAFGRWANIIFVGLVIFAGVAACVWCCNACHRANHARRQRGCGWWIIPAMFSTLYATMAYFWTHLPGMNGSDDDGRRRRPEPPAYEEARQGFLRPRAYPSIDKDPEQPLLAADRPPQQLPPPQRVEQQPPVVLEPPPTPPPPQGADRYAYLLDQGASGRADSISNFLAGCSDEDKHGILNAMLHSLATDLRKTNQTHHGAAYSVRFTTNDALPPPPDNLR